jgi:hypothetical protein
LVIILVLLKIATHIVRAKKRVKANIKEDAAITREIVEMEYY